MRVLVACEFSGVVRRAFRALGLDAWSCDLLPAEDKDDHHIQGDIAYYLDGFPKYPVLGYTHRPILKWDMLIAFPPCTHLSVSGARWFKGKATEQNLAIEFFKDLADSDIPRIAIENPIGIMSTHYRKPDQIIQPWQFGHGETKATCLWLKNLPKLVPTNVVEGREARIHKMPPRPNRGRERSRTYEGIARAMAEQWGGITSKPETKP